MIKMEEEKYYIIYKTTNILDGKFYIGQHEQLTSGADNYLGSGTYLKRSMKKYGKENFVREILEYCTSANINDREIYWINITSACIFGYNLTSGGEGTRGYRHTQNSREQMSESRKNVIITEEWKQHMREAAAKRDQSGENSPTYGKVYTDEEKLKMSLRSRGFNSPDFCKNKKYNYIGVTPSSNKTKNGKPWRARISYNCKSIHIGVFNTEIEAAKAYNKKAIELYGDRAILNVFVEDEND